MIFALKNAHTEREKKEQKFATNLMYKNFIFFAMHVNEKILFFPKKVKVWEEQI